MNARVFSWNVNGLRAVINRGALQEFIAQFSPDILALQETKLQESQLAALKLDQLFPDYQMFWSFATRKGYSGTAIWVKKTLPAHKVILEKNLELSDKYGCACEEGRLTAVELAKTLVVSLYAPNGKEDLSRIPLRVKYDAHINSLLKPYKKVLLLGDFNVANEPIDVANPDNKKGKHGFTDEERTGFKNYLKSGFHDVWREENPDKIAYTWWSFRVRNYDPSKPKPGWRIDYALAKGLQTGDADIHPSVHGSDHCPISLEIQESTL
ncbi:exodeoxyribonuclease III [Candidatus Saccharibacteria bacterium]|nr:exodeoxyribonuclease III [Candidatus Saccharibacteria bacterium]